MLVGVKYDLLSILLRKKDSVAKDLQLADFERMSPRTTG